MKRLIVVPTQKEVDLLLQGFNKLGLQAEAASLGRLPVVQFDDLGVAVAKGGLGKVQFAIQTQHLLDLSLNWDMAICAGAAGALVDGLSPGDIVVSTETIEHDILSKFSGKPLVPRFRAAEAAITALKDGLPVATSFQVHFGPIASGDEDVVSPERRREIHKLTGALAVA
ncbi:MAG TPA: hypothetical protein VHM88_00875 [Candidatus Acidoferrales bacterium]|nr:hypothetical protein [Candidatus Acidoferrales bacterium]